MIHDTDTTSINSLCHVIYIRLCSLFMFFVFLVFCRLCVVIRFCHPRHNGQWPPTSKDFLSQIVYPLHLFSYLNSWARASISPFECSVLNKEITGTIFITSLVWRGPWLGIESGTSLTRSQHWTTRLSRTRYGFVVKLIPINEHIVWSTFSIIRNH